jgi:hypothetical protein
VDRSSDIRIRIVAREEWDDPLYTLLWDIREHLYDLLVCFGNGVWVEIRIEPETQEGLEVIRGILTSGGYKVGYNAAEQTTLFQAGDECWAGFVFIDPTPKSLSSDLQ